MAEARQSRRLYGMPISWLGAQILANFDQEIFNPQLLACYFPSMLKDETIRMGLNFLASNVVRRMRSYRHSNPEIQSYVRLCEKQMQGDMRKKLKAAIRYSVAFGWCPAEFAVTSRKGQWLLSAFYPYDPQLCSLVMHRNASSGAVDITYIKQHAGAGDIDIPRYKCVLFNTEDEHSPFGYARLDLCYRWWSFKRSVLRFWAVAIEKFGMPTVIGKTSNAKTMETALDELYSKGILIIGKDDSVDYLEKMSYNTGEYSGAITYANKMMYRSIFLPTMLENSDVIEGKRSGDLGENEYEMFVNTCMDLANEVVETLIDQLWRPLIIWNFGEQDDYGTIPVTSTLSVKEKESMSRVFYNLTNTGLLYPEAGDEDWMRGLLDMPTLDPELMTDERKEDLIRRAEFRSSIFQQSQFASRSRGLNSVGTQQNSPSDARSSNTNTSGSSIVTPTDPQPEPATDVHSSTGTGSQD